MIGLLCNVEVVTTGLISLVGTIVAIGITLPSSLVRSGNNMASLVRTIGVANKIISFLKLSVKCIQSWIYKK